MQALTHSLLVEKMKQWNIKWMNNRKINWSIDGKINWLTDKNQKTVRYRLHDTYETIWLRHCHKAKIITFFSFLFLFFRFAWNSEQFFRKCRLPFFRSERPSRNRRYFAFFKKILSLKKNNIVSRRIFNEHKC